MDIFQSIFDWVSTIFFDKPILRHFTDIIHLRFRPLLLPTRSLFLIGNDLSFLFWKVLLLWGVLLDNAFAYAHALCWLPLLSFDSLKLFCYLQEYYLLIVCWNLPVLSLTSRHLRRQRTLIIIGATLLSFTLALLP